MSDRVDAIYLAPHLDDAALSCGGRIAAQTGAGQTVLIVTIMAGDPAGPVASPLVQALHDRWQLAENAVARRREEDRIACAHLGAVARHWDIPDCIYRIDPAGHPFYPTEAHLFDQVALEEAALVAQLADRLATLPPAQIYAPLAVGNHVDHQITRGAAERCFGTSLWYYEDYPYVSRPDSGLEALTAGPAWRASTLPLTPAHLEQKRRAIAAYASQVSTFFRDAADLAAQVAADADRVGGERVWQRA